MFGRHYPIWNKVTACIYKNGERGAKSYGVRELALAPRTVTTLLTTA